MPTEANSINAATTGIVGNTGTAFTATAVTAHNVLLGGATSSTLVNVAPSATSGVPVISQGAAADPVFGTALVAGGGTGATTLTGVLTGNGTSAFTASTVTQHGVLVGGASNAVGSTAVGSTGQVLQANTGADPTYSTATYPSTAGSSGNILTSNGTNWSSTAPSGAAGGLRLIQSQTAANVASLDFTTGLTYSAYYVVFSNIAPATAGALLTMRYSTNGGSTYLTTGYFSGNNSSTYSSTTMGNNNSTTAILLTADIGNAAGATGNGYVTIVQTSGREAVTTGQSSYFSNAASLWAFGTTMGVNTTTSTVNALRFLFTTGNISAGVITLYGIAQS